MTDKTPPPRGKNARTAADEQEEAAAVRAARTKLRGIAIQHLQSRALHLRRIWFRNNVGLDPLLPIAGQLASAPGGDNTRAGADGLAFRIALLALWAAGGKSDTASERFNPHARRRAPHSTALLPKEDLTVMLGLMGAPTTNNRRVQNAMSRLTSEASYSKEPYAEDDRFDRPAATRGALLDVEWVPDPAALGWTVTLRDDLGSGDVYLSPGEIGGWLKKDASADAGARMWNSLENADADDRPWWADTLTEENLKLPPRERTVPLEHIYFTLPPEFFVNGWWTVLPAPAMHLWLWMRSQIKDKDGGGPPRLQPTEPYRHVDWVVPTRQTYEHCVRLLDRWNLIDAEKRTFGRSRQWVMTLKTDTEAFVEQEAPLHRPPTTRMGADAFEVWIDEHPEERLPQKSLAEPLLAPKNRSGSDDERAA